MATAMSGVKVSLPTLSGEDDHYEGWRFVLRAYLGRYGLTQALDSGELIVQQSQEIYYVIANSLGGTAAATVYHVQEGDGLEAWRSLEARYDSNRVTAKFPMIRKLMAGKCEGPSTAEE